MDNEKDLTSILHDERICKEFEKDYNESGVASLYSPFGDTIQKGVFFGHIEYWASLQTEHAVSVVSYLTRILANYHAYYAPVLNVNKVNAFLKNASMTQEMDALTGFQLLINGFAKSLVKTEGIDNALKITDGVKDELYECIMRMEHEKHTPFPVLLITEGTPWIEDKIKSMNGRRFRNEER